MTVLCHRYDRLAEDVYLCLLRRKACWMKKSWCCMNISQLRWHPTPYIISWFWADNQEVSECRVMLDPTLTLHSPYMFSVSVSTMAYCIYQKTAKSSLAYSGRYPFTNSGDIRSVRWWPSVSSAKLILFIVLSIYTIHCFKYSYSALCPEDVLANGTYCIRGFFVLLQIDEEVCLDEYLIIQILAYVVSVMMGDEPTDTFNLAVSITAESR